MLTSRQGVLSSPDAIRTTDIGKDGVITNSTKDGGLVSIYYLGALVGCLWGGSISDKHGRKIAVFLGTLWGIIGTALLTAAQNTSKLTPKALEGLITHFLDWFLCARLIAGVGTGHLINVVPCWASELAPSHTRGKSVCLLFLANYIGIAVAYWIAFGVSYVNDGQGGFRWRFPIGFNLIPVLILSPTIWFFPESPRWLIKQDRHEEALEILQKLREDSAKGDVTPQVAAEFDEIRRVIASETQHATRDSLWAMPFGYQSGKLHYGRRVALAFCIQIMMEW
jgi:MFS family permease